LSAVSYELHQTSSHCYIIAKENNFLKFNLIKSNINRIININGRLAKIIFYCRMD
jgi:hypothetical protein